MVKCECITSWPLFQCRILDTSTDSFVIRNENQLDSVLLVSHSISFKPLRKEKVGLRVWLNNVIGYDILHGNSLHTKK